MTASSMSEINWGGEGKKPNENKKQSKQQREIHKRTQRLF